MELYTRIEQILYRAHLRSYGVYGTMVNDVNRKEHELLKQSDR